MPRWPWGIHYKCDLCEKEATASVETHDFIFGSRFWRRCEDHAKAVAAFLDAASYQERPNE